ncbi:DeoR family transcriptional regulator [Vibrio parahaemolyticus]|nr:DeoR family transcriptional regulator [Vibrio parahaemolyticus]EIT7132067.1 DeoR family transcriptional regulator [Vibrio parahaemolyticus]EIZ1368879.1 DeoR family transcriptional regulator [Vibrio parahaemolyticus]EIZ4252518.1 DeoR family transcriptional regulator [Vibrio parahaemolyticus]
MSRVKLQRRMVTKSKKPSAVKGRKWRNMVTKQLERLRRIEACLKHSDKIHLKEIARLLEVSEMTVRRDLSSNAAHSFPLEYYGGYIRRGDPIVHDEVTEDLEQMSSEVSSQATPPQKARNTTVFPPVKVNNYISAIVSDFIEMNDVVYFDNGVLNADIIGSIPDHVKFTGVTASMNVFLALKNKPNCKAILQGGDYNAVHDIFISTSNDVLTPMIFQKVFISSAGVHDRFGVTASDMLVANIAHLVMERSMKKYLIVEKKTINQTATYKIGNLLNFHYLISDDALPHKLEAACNEARLQVLTPTG